MKSSPGASEGRKESLLYKIGQMVWPIKRTELLQFFFMTIILFGALFSYTIVRSVKDSLITTAPHSGAFTLPWLKTCFVLPGSLGFMLWYAKFSNTASRERLFMTSVGVFMGFFALFAFVLAPMSHQLNCSPETVASWQAAFPMLSELVPALGYWTYSLFFVASELWGNVALGLLFWQFANQITSSDDAKRLYPVFSLWSNVALLVASELLSAADHFVRWYYTGAHISQTQMDLYTSQFLSMAAMVGAGLMVVGYLAVDRLILKKPNYVSPEKVTKKKGGKPKLSLGESLKVLAQSRYLMMIAILVLAYGLCINLVEVSWKDAIKDLAGGSSSQYLKTAGAQYRYIGFATMGCILLCQSFIRIFGWTFSAIITPVAGLVTGAAFFMFLMFKSHFQVWFGLETAQVLGVIVSIGMVNNVVTKSVKYALYDPTKEMAYIPLDADEKLKGKAAIDLVGGRLGKSAGSIVNMIAKRIAGTPLVLYGLLGTVMVSVSVCWVWAVMALSGMYAAKLKEREQEAAQEKTE